MQRSRTKTRRSTSHTRSVNQASHGKSHSISHLSQASVRRVSTSSSSPSTSATFHRRVSTTVQRLQQGSSPIATKRSFGESTSRTPSDVICNFGSPQNKTPSIRSMSTSSNSDAPTYKYLITEQKGPTMYVTMNRPEVHNAFNEHVIAELTTAFKSITHSIEQHLQDETIATKDSKLIRSVVLAGNGPSFSAGADLNWMAKMAKYTEEENRLDSLALYDMFHSIHSCPVPVIARVNGGAFGGGSGLVAACDFAYALDSAKLGFTEVALGLVPAVISRFCVDKIGAVHAKRYFVTGERFSAAEAMRIGLVQQVFPTIEELDKGIEKITSIMNNNSPAATRRAKQLVKDLMEQDLTLDKPETREFTASVIAKIRVSEEGQAGLNAFLNKQSPPWKL